MQGSSRLNFPDRGAYGEAIPIMSDIVTPLLSDERIDRHCRRHQTTELALFGSDLSKEYGTDSDIDLLVQFAPSARVTFTKLSSMRRDLEDLLGRKVDLVPKDCLKPIIRDRILSSAQAIYEG